MPGSIVKFSLNYKKLRSPEMQGVLLETPAMLQFVDYPAAAVAVHAQVNHDTARPVITAITSPANPRNVSCAFGAAWDAGDVTITGTDQFDRVQTEVIADNAGNSVAGVKIFKTITSITWEAAGTDGTLDVVTGDKLGLPLPLKYAWGIELVAGVAEACTFDATYHAFTPTTVADGGKDYTLLVPVDWAKAKGLNIH